MGAMAAVDRRPRAACDRRRALQPAAADVLRQSASGLVGVRARRSRAASVRGGRVRAFVARVPAARRRRCVSATARMPRAARCVARRRAARAARRGGRRGRLRERVARNAAREADVRDRSCVRAPRGLGRRARRVCVERMARQPAAARARARALRALRRGARARRRSGARARERSAGAADRADAAAVAAARRLAHRARAARAGDSARLRRACASGRAVSGRIRRARSSEPRGCARLLCRERAGQLAVRAVVLGARVRRGAGRVLSPVPARAGRSACARFPSAPRRAVRRLPRAARRRAIPRHDPPALCAEARRAIAVRVLGGARRNAARARARMPARRASAVMVRAAARRRARQSLGAAGPRALLACRAPLRADRSEGPGDRLQDNQIRWLDYCVRHRMPVRVLDVRWTGDARASSQGEEALA